METLSKGILQRVSKRYSSLARAPIQLKKGDWGSGAEALQKKMGKVTRLQKNCQGKKGEGGFTQSSGKRRTLAKRCGCTRKDKPKLSLSMSTDPTSERVSESPIGPKQTK